MRVYNFSAGPAMVPEPVLRQAAEEMLDWHGHGMSVMEMSHRSPEFLQIAEETESDLRQLMNIPDNYKVLFLQGGATGQFSAIPMNLARQDDTADYVVNGIWGKKAAGEAEKFVKVNIAARADPFTYVPDQKTWAISPKSAYIHITPNETINGLAFNGNPALTRDVPLVGDISSMILSESIDVSRYGVLYAGAQKNMGPAGLAIVIVREDLLDRARAATPLVWHWSEKSIAGSMVNTPPTYSWYLAGLICKWLKSQGGVDAISTINRRKAKKLYDFIDGSDFYDNGIKPDHRSKMNIIFTLAKPDLDKTFAVKAHARGLKNLGGHRSVGGLRASIYNAMPEAGVDALIKFMKEFEKKYG
ncbi:MAG: 3-phosphoserine/phosphohydroxythreonine transaminase [Candidatus Saccharimonadales bacterium]